MYDPQHNKQFKLLERFVDVDKMGRVWKQCTIHATPQTQTTPERYSYLDHYRLKDQDTNQHRFCAKTEVSKNYEITLKSNSSTLVPDLGDFMWDVKMPKGRRKL